MIKRYLYLLISFCIIFISSCTEEVDTYELDYNNSYYPLVVGKYLTYQLDSVTYDPDQSGILVDSSTTFVKELIVEKFVGLTGDTVFRVERFERKNDSIPWALSHVWSTTKNASQVIRTEDNLRFLNMVFPLTQDKRWKSTAYIDEFTIVEIEGETIEFFKNWSSYVLDLNYSDQIGDHTFENLVTISQADYESAIDYRYVLEKYAENVGLVFRELKVLNSQCVADCEGMTWEERAEQGVILKQTIIDFN